MSDPNQTSEFDGRTYKMKSLKFMLTKIAVEVVSYFFKTFFYCDQEKHSFILDIRKPSLRRILTEFYIIKKLKFLYKTC